MAAFYPWIQQVWFLVDHRITLASESVSGVNLKNKNQPPPTNLSINDSEIRYRRLFEAAQDGILILDAETGMIEDVNPYLIKMLGYSR